MPVSKARSATARANGAKSKGPATPEGKARSAQNSRRHGILSSDFVLRTENPETLRALEEQYTEEWQPVGPTESDLVSEMALCRYRQSRIIAVEVAAWDLQMDKDAPQIEQEFAAAPDNAVRSAIAFQNLANETRTLDLTNRYETRFHRQYMRALKELKDLQDRRRRAGYDEPSRPPADPILPNEPNGGHLPVAEQPVAASPAPVIDKLPNEPNQSVPPPAAAIQAPGNTPDPSALGEPPSATLPNEPGKSVESHEPIAGHEDEVAPRSGLYYVVLSNGLEA